jgi:hypothetical protein
MLTSAEGEDLRDYFGIVVIGWITAGIILVEKLLTIIKGKMEISAFKKNHPTLFDAMNDAGCHLLLYSYKRTCFTSTKVQMLTQKLKTKNYCIRRNE